MQKSKQEFTKLVYLLKKSQKIYQMYPVPLLPGSLMYLCMPMDVDNLIICHCPRSTYERFMLFSMVRSTLLQPSISFHKKLGLHLAYIVC